ncbi:MAG: methyltransferase domain-containing protein [Candidatus Pacebacteria bacterium]|nr:methyltransferase domain-containing protein [Candidatus Paceibacterota bacterium]
MRDRKKLFKEFNKEYYTSGGYTDYLSDFKQEGLDYAKQLIKKIKPEKSWKFLDVGCGLGGVVLGLRKLGYEAWGTEVSPFCLENSPVKQYLQFGDILDLPLADNSFEVVLTCDAVYYLKKEAVHKALLEIYRVVSKIFFIENICQDSIYNNQKDNYDPLRSDKDLLTKAELDHLIQKIGFQKIGPLFSKGKYSLDFNNLYKKI